MVAAALLSSLARDSGNDSGGSRYSLLSSLTRQWEWQRWLYYPLKWQWWWRWQRQRQWLYYPNSGNGGGGYSLKRQSLTTTVLVVVALHGGLIHDSVPFEFLCGPLLILHMYGFTRALLSSHDSILLGPKFVT